MNEIINNIDNMNDSDFFILVFLIFSFFWSISIILKTKKDQEEIEQIIKKSKKTRKDRELSYQNFLEQNADPYEIYLYFLKEKRLPESLHNIMLANSLNDEYYSTNYLRSIDVNTKLAKDKIKIKCW